MKCQAWSAKGIIRGVWAGSVFTGKVGRGWGEVFSFGYTDELFHFIPRIMGADTGFLKGGGGVRVTV